MYTQIIELDTFKTVRKYANCADSFPAFVQNHFGNKCSIVYRHVIDGKVEGTVEKQGEHFDVIWSDDHYRVIPA